MDGPTQFETMDPASRDRAAAIAAMGYRLAAAGPRMRQRLQRGGGGADWWGIEESAAPDAAPEPLAPPELDGPDEEAMQPDPIPWARIAVLARRGVLLAGAACCGFGAVYAGMTMNIRRAHPGAAVVADAGATTTAKPQAPLEVAAQAPTVTAAAPPAAAAPAAPAPAVSVAATAGPPVAQAAPAPAAPPARPAAKLAEAARPAPAPTHFLIGETRLAPPHASRYALLPRLHPARLERAVWHAEKAGRPERRTVLASYTLPRWLTEPPAAPAAPPAATPPRKLVMSPPPGVLSLPATAAVPAAPAPAAAPAPEAKPPAPAAPEMVASVLPRIPERPRELSEESGYAREPVEAPPPAAPAYSGGYEYAPPYPYYGGYPE